MSVYGNHVCFEHVLDNTGVLRVLLDFSETPLGLFFQKHLGYTRTDMVFSIIQQTSSVAPGHRRVDEANFSPVFIDVAPEK
jgi:hypothetical protein